MKKLKISLMALLFTVGIGGAVVAKIHAAPKGFDATYNWHRVAGDPQPGEINPLNGATISQAQDNYGCDGETTQCAAGSNTVVGQPGASIFLSE